MLIELGRYPEAADLLERNVARVLPGIGHDPPQRDARPTWPSGPATWPPPDGTSRSRERGERHRRRPVRHRPPHVRDRDRAVGRRPGRGPRRSPARASTGWSDMDDAIILGQLAIPAVRAAADLAVRGPGRRATRPPPSGGRRGTRRDRALPRRDRAPDATRRARRSTRSAGGWRSARRSSPGRAGADDRGRLAAVRPALAARPAPFLEAYVLWRAAEAPGRVRARRPPPRPLREGYAIAAPDRRRACSWRASTASAAGCGSTSRRRVPRRRAGAASAAGRPVAATPADPFGLTAREREVLALVAEGYTNRRIADDAVHQREHGRRPRLAHPGQARRRDADRGGGGRGQARARSATPRSEAVSGRVDATSVAQQAPERRLDPLLERGLDADVGQGRARRLARLGQRVAERLERGDDLALARGAARRPTAPRPRRRPRSPSP